MSALPFIDEHDRRIDASTELVFSALVATIGRITPELPGWLTTAWGLDPIRRSGDWAGSVSVGDSVPGFAATAIEPGQSLVLRGNHRFAEYELRFELEPSSTGQTRLCAKTSADFHGLKGRLYRALVIGTGGHRVAVGRILARVSRRVGSTGAGGPAD
jgi:hypothetical protein